MSYCPNCGKALGEGAHFCANCGQSLQVTTPHQETNNPKKQRQLHCPECKSTNISPVVETEISGGTSFNHSFSRKNSVSAMQFNNTHRNYWMCHSCGCKFRNIQNLQEEIQKTQGLVKRGILGAILWCIFTLLTTIMGGFGFITVLNIFIILLIGAAILYLRNRIGKLSDERAYLKKHCFN